MDRNRRIGVGHLGVQGYWAKQGVKYSELASDPHAEYVLRRLSRIVRDEARKYAFKLRIPEPVKVTTVAPTGTIAKLPGVTEGIHPVYARWFERRIRFSLRDPAQKQSVEDFRAQGFTVEQDVYDNSGQTAVVVFPTEDILVAQVRELGLPEDVVQSADELTIHDLLGVQRLYQKHYADNAVSFTCNIAEGSVSYIQLAAILAEYLPDLKGTTIMVDASRPQAPYKRITHDEFLAAVATRIEDSTSEECSSGSCPVR
jgi:adenosylcobalamin-dependent ribonucleoside-triphosphate reductase